MDKKIANIKERVLYIAKFQGVSYEKFCNDLGMTYGNFKGKAKKTPVNSDFLENIITKYPNINCKWLLTGKGDMLIKETDLKEKPIKKGAEDDPVMREMVLLLSKTVKDFQDRLNRMDKKFDEIDENFNSITETIAYQELNSITREIEEDKITAEMQKKIKEIEVKESTEGTPVN